MPASRSSAPRLTLHDDDWLRQLHVNLSGSFYVVREAARRMIPRGRGAIVITGSELGLLGQPGYVGYTATKGGVLAMTRAFAAELAVHGIRVNSISPGTTETPMLMAEFAAAPDPAQGARGERVHHPAGPLRATGRHRGGRCVPVVRRGRLHHRQPTWSSTAVAHRVSPQAPSARPVRRRCGWPWCARSTGPRRSGPPRGARKRR